MNAVSQNQYVAVGGRGTIWHSQDSRQWTSPNGDTLDDLWGLAFAGGQLVALTWDFSSGEFRSRIWSSSDGRGWERRFLPGRDFMEGLAAGPAGLVVVGDDEVVFTSSTGAEGQEWLKFSGAPNRSYVLEYSEQVSQQGAPAQWIPFETFELLDTTTLSLPVSRADQRGFFRGRALP